MREVGGGDSGGSAGPVGMVGRFGQKMRIYILREVWNGD